MTDDGQLSHDVVCSRQGEDGASLPLVVQPSCGIPPTKAHTRSCFAFKMYCTVTVLENLVQYKDSI